MYGSEAACKRFADKLVEIAKYYNFEGWLINIENPIPVSNVPVRNFCLHLALIEMMRVRVRVRGRVRGRVRVRVGLRVRVMILMMMRRVRVMIMMIHDDDDDDGCGISFILGENPIFVIWNEFEIILAPRVIVGNFIKLELKS